MKTNGHYAAAMPMLAFSNVENGLRPDQVGHESTDMFLQEDRYFAAYADYFGRFLDAYRELGIPIRMVMPQNEFNSAQVFPSCTWTPEGLARFLRHLGPAMSERGVEVFLGTLERSDDGLVTRVLEDELAAGYIKGVGTQWHGKGAIPFLHHDHPELRLYQTEQECGDGRNDWRFARYAWTQLKHYLSNGANAYMYWNISLERGGLSRWGWSQNSLVTVQKGEGDAAATFTWNHEYYLLKHVSHFVQPGARSIRALSYTGYENQLVFENPDGSTVIVVQNDSAEVQTPRIHFGDRVLQPALPADSFNTFALPASIPE